jgi:hypothetical protein
MFESGSLANAGTLTAGEGGTMLIALTLTARRSSSKPATLSLTMRWCHDSLFQPARRCSGDGRWAGDDQHRAVHVDCAVVSEAASVETGTATFDLPNTTISSLTVDPGATLDIVGSARRTAR